MKVIEEGQVIGAVAETSRIPKTLSAITAKSILY